MRIGFVLDSGAVVTKRLRGDGCDEPLSMGDLLSITFRDEATALDFASNDRKTIHPSWKASVSTFLSVESFYKEQPAQLLYLYRGEGHWEVRDRCSSEVKEVHIDLASVDAAASLEF